MKLSNFYQSKTFEEDTNKHIHGWLIDEDEDICDGRKPWRLTSIGTKSSFDNLDLSAQGA